MRQYGRKRDRLEEYNNVFHSYNPTDEPRGIERDDHLIEILKLRLDEIKSIYNYYKKIFIALISIGFAILGLSLGLDSVFCQCGLKQLSCVSLALAIASFVFTTSCILSDLILLYHDPEKYFSSKYTTLKEIMEVASSSIHFFNRMYYYYGRLAEHYEAAVYRLKSNLKPNVASMGLAFVLSLVASILCAIL